MASEGSVFEKANPSQAKLLEDLLKKPKDEKRDRFILRTRMRAYDDAMPPRWVVLEAFADHKVGQLLRDQPEKKFDDHVCPYVPNEALEIDALEAGYIDIYACSMIGLYSSDADGGGHGKVLPETLERVKQLKAEVEAGSHLPKNRRIKAAELVIRGLKQAKIL